MQTVLIGVLVTGALVGLTATTGYFLSRTGKPYRFPRLALHLAAFVASAVAIASTIVALTATGTPLVAANAALLACAASIAINFALGVVLAVSKSSARALSFFHAGSAALTALSIVAAAAFVGLKL